MKDPGTGLSDRQRRFTEAYSTSLNATASYQEVFGGGTKTAAVEGCKLLKNPNIQKYLAEIRDRASKESLVSLERVLEEVGYIAFSNIAETIEFSPDGVVLASSQDLDQRITRAISSVSVSDAKISLKQHDKMRALTLLADYFGIRDDFNKARATLARYGLAVVPDEASETGWAIERYQPE